MAKKKNEKIIIVLKDIKETIYRFNYDFDYSTLSDRDLKIGVNHMFNYDIDKNSFDIEFAIKYFVNEIEETDLVELGLLTSFEINPLTSFISVSNNDKFTTKEPIIFERICTTCIDTLRGVLFSHLKGTDLSKFPLPMLPIKEILATNKIRIEK